MNKTRTLNTIRLVLFKVLPEKLMIYFVSGRVYGSLLTKIVPNHYQFKPHTKRIAKRFGISFELDLSDIVDWFIYFGFLDPAKERLINLIGENHVVFDVGTNVGEITLRAAQRVGDQGMIHSFEPCSENLKRLKRNLKLNKYRNIELDTSAVGHESGAIFLESPDQHNLGTTRVNPKSLGEDLIPLITIDNYVIAKQIIRIDIIKVDVEGFESNVLKGASNSIKRFKPILFFELDDKNLMAFNSSAKDLVNEMYDLSYKVLDARNESVIDDEVDLIDCHLDILCVPL